MAVPPLTVAMFLEQQLATCGRSQREVAAACGYRNPNIITMFKTGATKVPIETAPALAVAIGADPAFMVRLVMQEYLPGCWATIESIIDEPGPVTPGEREIVQLVRTAANGREVDLTSTSNRIGLTDAVRECVARDHARACAAVSSMARVPPNARNR